MDWFKIQEKLNELGFNAGDVDGLKGPRTDAAIIAFKRSIGLRSRAYVGPLTYEALMTAVKPTLEHPSNLPWMAAGLMVKGLHEDRNYSALKAWFGPSVAWIDPREIAWCGAFVQTCHRIADPKAKTPENPLGARNWGKFGVHCPPVFGATLTFWRGSRSGWKGHVGFYFGEDASAFHVLGGNQSNAVTVTRISKSRLLESRWPTGVKMTGKQIMLATNGRPLSTNEA